MGGEAGPGGSVSLPAWRAPESSESSPCWQVLAFVALPELASAFIEVHFWCSLAALQPIHTHPSAQEIFQQFGAGGGQQLRAER